MCGRWPPASAVRLGCCFILPSRCGFRPRLRSAPNCGACRAHRLASHFRICGCTSTSAAPHRPSHFRGSASLLGGCGACAHGGGVGRWCGDVWGGGGLGPSDARSCMRGCARGCEPPWRRCTCWWGLVAGGCRCGGGSLVEPVGAGGGLGWRDGCGVARTRLWRPPTRRPTPRSGGCPALSRGRPLREGPSWLRPVGRRSPPSRLGAGCAGGSCSRIGLGVSGRPWRSVAAPLPGAPVPRSAARRSCRAVAGVGRAAALRAVIVRSP